MYRRLDPIPKIYPKVFCKCGNPGTYWCVRKTGKLDSPWGDSRTATPQTREVVVCDTCAAKVMDENDKEAEKLKPLQKKGPV